MYQHGVDLIRFFRLQHQFLMLLVQFGEVSSDELAKGAVVEAESPCQRFYALGGRGVDVHGFPVFPHAVRSHYSAVLRLFHPQTRVQFRFVLFQVLA